MFLKDHLKDTYQKASFDKNHLMVENIINIWAHRFGIGSLNELISNNQDQTILKKEDSVEENRNQINMELLENFNNDKEVEFKAKETKTSNSIYKSTYGSYKNKSEYKEIEELPLPNINNLRKWINNEKKAS